MNAKASQRAPELRRRTVQTHPRQARPPQTSVTAVAGEGQSGGEGLRKHRGEGLSKGKGPSKRDEDGRSLPDGRQGHGRNTTTVLRHLTLDLRAPSPFTEGGAQAANTSRRKRDERLLQRLTALLRNLTDGEADDDDDDGGDEEEVVDTGLVAQVQTILHKMRSNGGNNRGRHATAHTETSKGKQGRRAATARDAATALQGLGRGQGPRARRQGASRPPGQGPDREDARPPRPKEAAAALRQGPAAT